VAEKKNSNEAADLNFEDLLSFTGDEKPEVAATPEVEPTPEPVAAPAALVEDDGKMSPETAEALGIKEPEKALEEDPEVQALRKALAEAKERAAAAEAAAPPVEDPKDKLIRELKEQLVAQNSKNLDDAPLEYERTDGAGETILIHFIANGFTAQGVGWQRGQEVEFVVGGRAYEQTKDRNGNTWIDLRDNPEAQILRYGAEYFRSGPFRGLPIGSTVGLTDPEDIAAVQEAAAIEAKRNRAAPLVS